MEGHPMGEEKFVKNPLVKALNEAIFAPESREADLRVDTPGGRFQIRWDEGGSATALGQLAFFAEWLEATGVFCRWVEKCPLCYTSPNAPELQDVLGTWLLSILDGQRRYSHVTALRGDSVAPQILGMTKMISDESLRRALAHLAPLIDEKKYREAELLVRRIQLEKTTKWMDEALRESIREALKIWWILDIDTTVKPLYGKQNGAEIGYNPQKPGRPSHAIHTYWMSNVRMVLDAEVQSGKDYAAKHSLPRLLSLLKSLSAEELPQLVRGDSAFGNDNIMKELEEIKQHYLFKLRQTANVKKMIQSLWSRKDWVDVGKGYQAVEASLKLTGWSGYRRVVVVRTATRGDLKKEDQPTRGRKKKQLSLALTGGSEPDKLWDYSVLVTNTELDLVAIGQLYRDRADCENGFDELKNQWGWGGYTTHDMERCNLSARAVALIYNWWSWYVRLAHPKARLEGITSRPMLLAGIARLTEHASQSRLYLTINHASIDKIKSMITNVRKGIDHVRQSAPQLTKIEYWKAMLKYIIEKMMAAKTENQFQTPLQLGAFSSFEVG
jgi:hypothetical protein